MPKQEGQKSKLLALLRIFETQTDENHLLNVPQLVGLLEQQGILCERKSVYSDIDALNALGYDIQLRRGRGGGYFLASRTFDLAELKLLEGAIGAAIGTLSELTIFFGIRTVDGTGSTGDTATDLIGGKML